MALSRGGLNGSRDNPGNAAKVRYPFLLGPWLDKVNATLKGFHWKPVFKIVSLAAPQGKPHEDLDFFAAGEGSIESFPRLGPLSINEEQDPRIEPALGGVETLPQMRAVS